MELQTLLITGSNGLVGTYLKEVITERSMNVFYNIIYLNRQDIDLRNENDVLQYFEKTKPSIVIHLAASVGGLYYNLENNYTIFSDNMKINNNILTACDIFKVSKLINILSTCIFPDVKDNHTTFESNKKNTTLNSKEIHNGIPHASNEGYSYSKRMLEIGSRLLTKKNNNFSVVNLIPTNLYGKYDNYNLKNAHVIPALIHKIYLAKKNNQPTIEIKGGGLAKRQFLYAKDFANIIVQFINYKKEQCVSCIVSPPIKEEINIAIIVDKLCECFSVDCPIIYNTESQGQYKKTCDNNELSQFIDFKFTSLDIGLQETVDYFIKNFKNVRK